MFLFADKGRKAKKHIQCTDDLRVAGSSLISKDGTKWEIVNQGANVPGRVGTQNILREEQGPTPLPKREIEKGNALSAFRLLIDDFIIKHIQKCTETEARIKSKNNSWTISFEEIYATIAIMYGRGLLAKGQSITQLWSTTWGPAFFRNTMSRNRFTEIMKYLRFDMRSTRSLRIKTDKFAMVSEIWNRFIENCVTCYKPGPNITVDEQLFPCKSRCPFTQYIASKPDKFGIKFWLAADNKSKYLLNALPYLGKDDSRPSNQPVAEHVVLSLVKPFVGKGRNVTMDNFFTSLKLAEKLHAKQTSIVGTLNRIRREVPQSVKSSKCNRYCTHILRTDKCTLTVYQSKPNKNVLLLSSMHRSVAVDNQKKRLPETVAYYNNTKYGVDVLDQMARRYSTKNSSRRWPIQVFYNMLDLAGINAVILYREVTGEKISRKDFLLSLATEMQQAFKKSVATNDDIESDIEVEEVVASNKRKQCQVRLCKNNKAAETCYKCKKQTCGKCTSKVFKKLLCKKCDK